MKENKKDKLIIKRLSSDKEAEVLFTLKGIRNTGSAVLIPHVIKLLSQTKSEKIRQTAFYLLSDLKYQEAAAFIIEAINNDNYQSIRKDLLTVCWQSNIDFGDYLDVFVKRFVEDDFLSSFEAFTVIENIESRMNTDMVAECIGYLKEQISIIEEGKNELLLELIHILQKFI